MVKWVVPAMADMMTEMHSVVMKVPVVAMSLSAEREARKQGYRQQCGRLHNGLLD